MNLSLLWIVPKTRLWTLRARYAAIRIRKHHISGPCRPYIQPCRPYVRPLWLTHRLTWPRHPAIPAQLATPLHLATFSATRGGLGHQQDVTIAIPPLQTPGQTSQIPRSSSLAIIECCPRWASSERRTPTAAW